VTTLLPGQLILKEGRALAPIWLGAAVAIVAGRGAGMLMGSLLAFILGAAALGVFSIGHEYGNRTLTSLLAQPLARSRLLLSKVLVLAALLVLLSVVAALVLLRANGIERMLGGDSASQWRLAIVVLTPLLGLCVAPWLTMVFRNATAGLVFTLAVPSALWIAGQIARAASVDFDFVDLEVGNPFAYEPALVLMTVGLVAISFIAAVHGRALFVGLEALDTPRDLWPSTVKRRPFSEKARGTSTQRGFRTHGPLLLFVQKEVRLYGLVFALAAFYAIGWSALWLARAGTYLADNSFEFSAAIYGLFIALLVGAISIAEERAMGTADTQSLQPWPFWKQWLAKFATVAVIALLLGLAVPRGLQAVLPLIDSSWPVGPDLGDFRFLLPNPLNGGVATILLTTLFSCYVSSLCVGGLHALLAALPLSFSLASLCTYLFHAVYWLDRTLRVKYGLREFWWKGLPTATSEDFRTSFLYSRRMAAIAFLGFVAMLLFFLLRNFRSGDRGTTTAWTQLPWVVVYAALAAVLIRGGDALFSWLLLTH
jgi:ABC-type transport system involved in multi-copper enzyme maturation permease subunit